MNRQFAGSLLLALLAAVAPAGSAAEPAWAPFVIPARLDAPPVWFRAAAPILTNSPRVVVRDGHFYRGAERVRFWGVNCAFAGSLPPPEEAAAVAARLAAFGVNNVRLHHMDTEPWPSGLWAADGKGLAPEALARLDRFVAELAARGVSVDLNLHVGRAHCKALGLPEPGTDMGKIVTLFVPAVIEAEKNYARMLLGHVNAVRGVRYADDPAVAIVEISNENSFFMWDGDEKLRALPPYYAELLRGQWNGWLQAKYYGSEAALRQTWAAGADPVGSNLLAGVENDPAAWALEQHEGCRGEKAAGTYAGRAAIALRPGHTDATAWHLQIGREAIKLEKGRYYTVSFRAAAERARPLEAGVGQAHEPWNTLGAEQHFTLSPEWREYRIGFEATASDDNARVLLSFGGNDTALYVADVALRPGGREGLRADESLEKKNVALYADAETGVRAGDRWRFLAEAEKAFWEGMREFVHGELRCPAPVAGTIVFGPLGLWTQSGMDYIDAHAYWHHPTFPHQQWDQGDWLIEQQAMSDHPADGTFPGLAASRLAGKPFTVTEYNHPAPNDYQAECVPMLASFAALQDWDGVWLYAYSHIPGLSEVDHIDSFFDIRPNPAKWGFMPAGAAIFRQAPSVAPATQPLMPGDWKTAADRLIELQPRQYQLVDAAGLKPAEVCLHPFAWTFGGAPAAGTAPAVTLEWANGLYAARAPWMRVATGRAKGDDARFELPDSAAAALVATDGKPLAESRAVLLTACGRCENIGMGFSADRRTVGRNWGHGPVRIEAVRGRVTVPGAGWKCRALDAAGQPAREVPLESRGGDTVVPLAPEYATMWYWLTR